MFLVVANQKNAPLYTLLWGWATEKRTRVFRNMRCARKTIALCITIKKSYIDKV